MKVAFQDLLQGALREGGEGGRPLPLRHTAVEATLVGPLVQIRLKQRFQNDRPGVIEVVYLFPLAHAGAVSELSLQVGARTIRGLVKEKEEAREIYEEARAAGAKSALLEQERPNLFTLSVANVAPGEEVAVEIVLHDCLEFDDGAWRFAFPLAYTPRYHDPATVPDAAQGSSSASSEKSASEQTPTLAFGVTGFFDAPLASVRSPSYAVEVLHQDLTAGRFFLKLSGEPLPDRDFVLEIKPQAETITPILYTHREPEKPGAFLLTLLPDRDINPERVLGREMIFVVDRSGSMSREPMAQARRALHACLRTLGPEDSFRIITFDTRVEEMNQEALPWTQETLSAADAYIRTIDARGGTDIGRAMQHALARKRDPEKMRFVVFMTDGAVGNESHVLQKIEENLRGARIYAFGIGSAVNRYLLDGMARIGRGTADYIALGEDIEVAVQRFQTKVAFPLLTDLVLHLPEGEITDVYPRPLPDLFIGEPIEITGRFHSEGPGFLEKRASTRPGWPERGPHEADRREHRGVAQDSTRDEQYPLASLEVHGRVAGGPFVQRIPLKISERLDETAPIARLWAKSRVEYLEHRARQNPQERADIRQEIISLGLRYGILTPYTSLVAVEEHDPSAPRDQKPERVDVPQLIPHGVEMAPKAPPAERGYFTGAPQSSPPPAPGAGRSGGLFNRVVSLIKSNLNDVISKAEDPEKMLDQAILGMQQQLVEAKKQTAVSIADEKRLQKQYEAEATHAREWEKKAITAVRAGDDGLAREALVQKAERDRLAAEHQKPWQTQRDATEKRKSALRAVNKKIEEAKRKKNLLTARQKRAEATKTIQQTMNGLTDTSAFDAFERMDGGGAEAEAAGELSAEYTGDSMDARFAQFEATGGSDDALAALKAQMALDPAPAALAPPPAPLAKPKSPVQDSLPTDLAQCLRFLGRTQRASGAWERDGMDDLCRTCLAVILMARGEETHRRGAYRPQLLRSMRFLEEQLEAAKADDLPWVVWALSEVARVTRNPGDEDLARRALALLPASDQSEITSFARGTALSETPAILSRWG